MQAIHRLPPNMLDMATRLDIFGVYVQPYLAFISKTTVKEFCNHFMATLRNVVGLPKHSKVREFLMVLNKIHPLDRIQNAYKSIYTKLI